VGRDLELWLSSPRTAVLNLVHAASLPAPAIGSVPVINLPGITVTVAEMIDSLARVAGPAAAERIEFSEDPLVRRIVSGWPARFDVARALDLGFSRDPGFESLIRDFIAHEAAG
jgi:nucleoside-diphosphate-sugar epimerase